MKIFRIFKNTNNFDNFKNFLYKNILFGIGIFSTSCIAGCDQITFLENTYNNTTNNTNNNIANQDNYYNLNDIEVGIIGDTSTVNRAVVSKMLSLAKYNKNEILALDKMSNFEDIDNNIWYDKYINAVYINGDMSGIQENEFDPMGDLTIMQTQYLINKYDTSKKIEISEDNQNKPISYALWCEIYLELMKDKNIIEENIVVLATSETSEDLYGDYILTDKGILCFEGLNLSLYINHEIKILRKENEVIAITEIVSKEPILKSAVITDINQNHIDIFIGGASKRLYYDNQNIEIDANTINQENNYLIADIKINDFNNICSIEYIEIFPHTVRGKVNKITQSTIQIDGIEYILDEGFKVYNNLNNLNNLNGLNYSDINNLIIGQDIANFYIRQNENKIYGAIIDTSPKFETIKVAITNDLYEFNNYYFDELIFSPVILNSSNIESQQQELSISVQEQDKNLSSLHIKQGQDFSISHNEKIIIKSLDGSGIQISSGLTRGYENPIFYGNLEISKVNNRYVLINEVTIEDYVSSVLASNTYEYSKFIGNAGVHTELLKSLAVIFRSKAIYYMSGNNSIDNNSLLEIGANIDDSSKFQLFNYYPIENIHKEASIDTMGEIMNIDNTPINPIYFELSCGTSGNSGEVWGDENYFYYPTESKSYLSSNKFFDEVSIYDNLEDEVNANIFFKTKDINSIEKESDWFRWSINFNNTTSTNINTINTINNINNIGEKIIELSSNINNNYYIKFFKDGKYISNYNNSITDIGNIKDIKVLERGEGGNIIKLEVLGDLETVRIDTDILIKQIFENNTKIKVTNNNGEIIELDNIPSSYFVFDKIYDADLNLIELTLYGGGYGHGVGMSLYGANKMAENLQTYDQILQTYYNNIEINNLNNIKI